MLQKSKVFLILSIIGIIGCIVGISEGSIIMIIFYALFAILFFYLWNTNKKAPKNADTKIKEISNIKSSMPSEEIDSKTQKAEKHRIAGVSYRQDVIMSLGIPNEAYKYTKSQLIKMGLVDKKIYEYLFSPSSVTLIPEPDNDHDPNAVKVVIDGKHVGYIKKGSCSHIKNLLNSNTISSISAKISGGKSKYVYCNDDCEDSNSYTMEQDKTDFHVEITITLK